MKNFVIVGNSVLLLGFLLGCANWLAAGFPEFPKEIKEEHLIIVTNGQADCFKMEITSFFPRKLAEPIAVPIEECDGLAGLLPKEAIAMDNWIDDVYKWGKENKCYKQ